MSVKSEWLGRWEGQTVICIASGPSLTAEDCETARNSGHPTIVTNTTFRLCPWADVLFGFDSKWWREYKTEVDQTFSGECLTFSSVGPIIGIETLHRQPWFQPYGNSGTAAISLAVCGKAKKVVMLGYDCQRTGGKTHWHGDHPKPLGNAASMGNWAEHFKRLAKFARKSGVEVLNCTRETALDCFPRSTLTEAL